MAISKPSLSDAELREYGFEDLFRDDVLPGDAAQMADDLTDLFAQQIGRKVVAQAVEGGTQGFGCRREGFVMAAVGDDRAAVVERFRIDRVAQDPAQVVDAGVGHPVVRQAGDEFALQAVVGQRYGDVGLASAVAGAEEVRLVETQVVGRREPQHDLPEGNDLLSVHDFCEIENNKYT